MKYVCALITVEDIIKSRKLYEGMLNQRVLSDFGENVTFEGGFSLHQRSHFQKLLKKDIINKSNSFELYFEEDELETVEAKILHEGLEFIHGISEQPWRQKVLRFYDYDANVIEIGERMEHVAYRLFREQMSVEEIGRITYLETGAIEKAIVEFSER